MQRVLFIQPTSSSFMELDFRILCQSFRTDRIMLHQENKSAYFLSLLACLLHLPKYRKYDLIVTWFSDYHSALFAWIAGLLHKKIVLFIGGYDAVYYPQVGIGVYNQKFRSIFVKYAIRHASLVIANHESLIEYNNTYIDGTAMLSGLKNIIPGFSTPFEVIYNGIDAEKIRFDPEIKQENLVLTCGATPTWPDVCNKGYDLMIETARRLPQFNFVLVGMMPQWLDRLEQEFHYLKLTNLTIYPFLPQEKLHQLIAQARIYVQPSMSEGMPSALMEAMLYGCIPVGSNVAGIPTVIDGKGVIFYQRRVDDLVNAILQASALGTGAEAAAYIREHFSLKIRTELITQAILSII